MTSVVDIINLALKDAGITGEGQTASADTVNDAFTTLVQMLGVWQSDGLYVYAQVDASFAPTGALTYTVGAGGNFNIARPVKIDYAYWRSGGLDYPLELLGSLVDYEQIGQKSIASAPSVAFYNPTYPTGTLYVWPQPTTGTLHIVARAELQAYSTIADNLSLPAEYQLAVRFSLAELLTVLFGTPLRPDIASIAAGARKILRRNNVRIPVMQMPAALGGRCRSSILRGY